MIAAWVYNILAAACRHSFLTITYQFSRSLFIVSRMELKLISCFVGLFLQMSYVVFIKGSNVPSFVLESRLVVIIILFFTLLMLNGH